MAEDKISAKIDLASATARLLVTKLNEEIARGHDTFAFVIMMVIALLKDLLELTPLGQIPVLSQFIGAFLATVIFAFMFGKGWFISTRVKVIYWVAGFFIDNLPAVSALPMETLTVLYAWHLVRKRAQKAEEKLRFCEQMTEEQVNELVNNIGFLDEGK